MSNPVSDLAALLRTMEPILNDGVYVYASVPHGTHVSQIQALATFREAEGITLITSEAEARRANLPVLFRAAWITLKVHSDLHAVGLTAAFSRTLGEAGISCNVVAAAYHDHLFVPVELATQAMARLRALQEEAAGARRLGRSFRSLKLKAEQTTPKDIDEYIVSFPDDIQELLQKMRATIKKAAPDAEEAIKYQMPTFTLKGNLVHFAAFKNHIGFYPAPSGIEKFKDELSAYKGAKGSVQFPLGKPIPFTLISKIVKFRAKENLERAEAKKKKR